MIKIVIGITTFTSLKLQKDLALELGHRPDLLDNPTISATIKSGIQADYAKANIYIKSLDVQSIQENEKYTVCIDILSQY